MTKIEWKQQAKNLKEENEFLKGQIEKQKAINNIAVGENYTLNQELKQLNIIIDFIWGRVKGL